MKHTPGDWEYLKMTGRVLSGDVRICGINGHMTDTGHANGRLIAAAPDLLAALECELALDAVYDVGQEIFKRHGYVKTDDKTAMQWVREKARAAIAKAKGGTA